MPELTVPLVVSLSGMPKTGKTHLAATFPGPIAYFEFDLNGIAPILPKFPDKEIDVYKFALPIIDTDPPKPYAEALWEQFNTQYIEAIGSGKYQTAVLDTSSMVWRILQHAEAELLNQKRILKQQFQRPNLRMNSIFTRAKLQGINFVTIQYLKDKYIDNERTNEQESDGWGQTEATVDLVLWTARQMKSVSRGKTGVTFEATIRANRYTPDIDGMVLNNTSYDELYALLGV